MNLPNSTNNSISKEDCLGVILQTAIFSDEPSAKPSAVFALIANVITCPFIILLNVLVMVAVQTKRELKINSNVVLACLASTDLLVGIVVQPFYIVFLILSILGKYAVLNCNLQKLFIVFYFLPSYSSLYHLVLVSGERYFAIKRTYSYQSIVTKPRIIAASILAWTLAMITFFLVFLDQNKLHVANLAFSIFTRVTCVILILYCHVVVYYEVHRHEKQIIHQQISEETKIQMRKEKRALKTTSIIIGTLAFCNVPALATLLPYSVGNIKTHLPIIAPISTTVLVLNSLCNPIIYTVRNRHFRVAFIQLLTRKSIAQADAVEMRYF